MKTLIGLLILVCNISFAQTIIEGKITSFPNTKYTIKIDQSSLNDYKGKTVAEGTTDSKGKFNTTIDIKNEQPVILYIGNLFFTLWARPNTSLSIWKDTDSDYSFSGGSSDENKILYESGLMQPYNTPKNIGLDEFKPKQQIAYHDSLERNRLEILNTTKKGKMVSDKFQSYFKVEVQNYTLYNLSQYAKLFKVSGKISDQDIPKDFFNFWSRFELVNDSTESNFYQSALQDYIEYTALERIGKNNPGTEKTWYETFRVADSLLQEKPLCLQKQKTGSLLLLIKYFSHDMLTKSEIEIYRKQFPVSESLALIENLWNKKHQISTKNLSFQLKNTKDEFVNIKDFKGNVIYIDFWGSWCKACLVNMPHAEKLKDKFENKNVVFLYINFYDTVENWTNAIEENNIGGFHLKAEKSDEDYFNKIFQIGQGFPRYSIIDKEGNLVSVSAPQPHEKAAYDLIQKYLND